MLTSPGQAGSRTLRRRPGTRTELSSISFGTGRNVSAVYSTAATAALCETRPKIGVATASTGDGRLRVTLTASGTSNILWRVEADTRSNVVIDTIGTGRPDRPVSIPVAQEATRVTFYIRRVAAGPVTVQLRVIDDCGQWQTFVGGGAGAF